MGYFIYRLIAILWILLNGLMFMTAIGDSYGNAYEQVFTIVSSFSMAYVVLIALRWLFFNNRNLTL